MELGGSQNHPTRSLKRKAQSFTGSRASWKSAIKRTATRCIISMAYPSFGNLVREPQELPVPSSWSTQTTLQLIMTTLWARDLANRQRVPSIDAISDPELRLTIPGKSPSLTMTDISRMGPCDIVACRRLVINTDQRHREPANRVDSESSRQRY